MKRLIQFFMVTAVFGVLTGCSTPAVVVYDKGITLSAQAKIKFEEYSKLSNSGAFVAEDQGQYAYTLNTSTSDTNVRTALAECQFRATGPCRVIDIHGEPYQEFYQAVALESRGAIAKLRMPMNADGRAKDCCYASEAGDWQVEQPSRLRTSSEPYYAPTPLALEGVTTLTTGQMVQRLKAGGITLIDGRGWFDHPTRALPSAYVIDWGGTTDSTRKEREDELRGNFERIVTQIQPDKSKPVAVYCHGSWCWLSINTLLRLRQIGYTNLYWYRGGMASWREAGLPTVLSLIYATAWSR